MPMHQTRNQIKSLTHRACAYRKISRRFEWVTGTTVESAAISSREDPVRLLTNLQHQGRGGLIRAVTARRGATGTAASIRGLGTLDLLLLEELIRVQGLVEEAALHRDSRGAGVEARGTRRTAGKASDMADGTAATVSGGRRRGEYFAGSGEPANCDDALAPGPVWVELPLPLSNFRPAALQSESRGPDLVEEALRP